MVLATSAFVEDATDREEFPDNELVSQNLSSCKKMNLRVTLTGKAATQFRGFFHINLLLGMTKYFLF